MLPNETLLDKTFKLSHTDTGVVIGAKNKDSEAQLENVKLVVNDAVTMIDGSQPKHVVALKKLCGVPYLTVKKLYVTGDEEEPPTICSTSKWIAMKNIIAQKMESAGYQTDITNPTRIKSVAEQRAIDGKPLAVDLILEDDLITIRCGNVINSPIDSIEQEAVLNDFRDSIDAACHLLSYNGLYAYEAIEGVSNIAIVRDKFNFVVSMKGHVAYGVIEIKSDYSYPQKVEAVKEINKVLTGRFYKTTPMRAVTTITPLELS